MGLTLEDCDWYEFFAGVGNLTTQMRGAGYRALRMDILDYQPPKDKHNFMDLTSPSGFAQLTFVRCGLVCIVVEELLLL